MTLEQANAFATAMRGFFSHEYVEANIFWLTAYASRVLGVQVGHFRDLSHADALKVYRHAQKDPPHE